MLTLWLLACIPTLPDAPPPDWSWRVERSALPATTLTVFETARVTSHMAQQLPGGSRSEPATMVAYAYLLDHPEHGLTLIDPGYPAVTVEHPEVYPGSAIANATKLEMGTPIVTQLGPRAADVEHVFTTHAHVDHIGAIADFPNAVLHITAEDWEHGRGTSVLHASQPWPTAVRSYSPVRFHGAAYGPFAHHADVFGDGSLIALPTPGHTPGHTSFVVNLPGSSVLLTGDTAWLYAHLEGPSPKGRFPSTFVETSARDNADSLVRLHALATKHPELIVLSGHDPANRERWPEDGVFR